MDKKNRKCYSGIGGQAVIEGIMMKNKNEYAVAVRKPNGEIEIKKEEYISVSDKFKILKIPFLRGIFAMIDSMILGIKTLNYSASFIEDTDSTESENKFEKWLEKNLTSKNMEIVMAIITVISIVFAIVIFSLLPAFLGSIIKIFVKSNFIIAFSEGILRILIFILYIVMISKLPDIQRTFEYHGSEHKCINCIENGLDLNVENVLKSSKEHKRCGTSFLVFVMIISIFLFMFIRVDNIWLKFLSRILLIPVVAGVSYEVLKLMGKFDNKVVDILSKPGLLMQRLTTREPNEQEVVVAIKAVESVFDWKEFQKKNFNKIFN